MQNKKVYIIAEAGVNHNGNKEMAFRLVDGAVAAGADAIKFQTFKAKKLASQHIGKAEYQIQNTGNNESQLTMLEALELPESWHFELQSYATAKGIDFLSTAFDIDSLHFLERLNMPFFKVPSGELTNAPLLWQFAKTGKPLIVSTGMATLSEVEQALAVITHGMNCKLPPQNRNEVWACWADDDFRSKLMSHVTLLHCTSQYPTPWENVNLKAMDTLASAFHLPVGYSDHTEGTVVALAAVARGASIIEKHLTLDRSLPGPDHKASLEEEQFSQMVKDIRAVELALGHGRKTPQTCEQDTRSIARQYIVAAKALSRGQIIEEDDLTTARTGEGLEPSLLWELIGTISKKNYQEGEIFLNS